jgi:hypothetical protein
VEDDARIAFSSGIFDVDETASAAVFMTYQGLKSRLLQSLKLYHSKALK